MKFFFYFIFFLKTDIRLNPEIILGKNYNDFGLAIGVGDDTDIGAYTYFKMEVYWKYKFKLNDIKLISKLGCFLEIGRRKSIGLKYKINYKFTQISLLIRKEKYKLNFQIEFGVIKIYKDYFCEISLGFHRSKIDQVKNQDEYILKIKNAEKEKLKKQILHKFIWNNNDFLGGYKIQTIYNTKIIKADKKIDFNALLNQYIKTFEPVFQEISSRKLNRILENVFIEQKKLFKKSYNNDYNICTKLNEYSSKFLTQNILDFDYQIEYKKEIIRSKNNYFSHEGIQHNLINRAIKYQKYSDNLFFLKPTNATKNLYKKHFKKFLVPNLMFSSNKKIGHVFMQQIEDNKVHFVDFQVSIYDEYFNINESEIPIAYGPNCVLYSYFLSVFALIAEDLNQGKKILLNFYKNFDEENKEKTKLQIIKFLKNPIESKNQLKYFLNNLNLYIKASQEKNKNFVQILKDIFLTENI